MVSKYHRNFAFDTIDDIDKQTTLPQVGVVFAGAMAKLGLNAVGINGLPPPEPDANPLIVVEVAPIGFRDCYIHEHLYLIDPNIERTRVTFETFRFSEALSDRAHSQDNDRFMQVLRDFGMGEGIVVPIGRPAIIPACVWLAGECPNLDDDALLSIQLISLFTASKALSLSWPRERSDPLLTAREREVLAWAAHGKSSWEIGMILNIAKRTVDEHTQVATRKLGAANRTQAVALAMLRRIIEI